MKKSKLGTKSTGQKEASPKKKRGVDLYPKGGYGKDASATPGKGKSLGKTSY